VKKTTPPSASYWLLPFALLLALVLAACVRPVPEPEQPATPIPTIAPTVELATAVPPAAATPIPAYPAPGGDDGGNSETPVTPPEATAVPDQGGETAETPEQPPANVSSLPTNHTVQAGDTLYSISARYGVSQEEIMAANNLTNPNALTVGQVLVIPAPGQVPPQPEQPIQPPSSGVVHIVQPGENLFRISLRYGKTVDEVAAYNGIANPHYIYPGQAIRIP
jgi:LysM repeat protein